MGFATLPVLLAAALLCPGAFSLQDNTSLAEFDNRTAVSHRDSRIFFLFPLFTPFRRRTCLAGTALSQRGVCHTAYQCTLRGGIASGSCASGRGVCCVFQYSCDGVSNANNYTYFTSPNYPSTYSGGSRCSITLTRANYTVCQIRINMLEFSLAPPSYDGSCSNDFMSNSANSFRICGENRGQHIFVDFLSGNTFTVSVDTNTGYTFDRTWYLELVQIPCSNGVPLGCRQYFNTTSGVVSSFNYATTASTSISSIDGSPGNRQIAGLSYGVCIRPVAGYCSIEWSASSSPYAFTVSGDTSGLDSTTLGTSSAEVTGSNCTSNFVVIPSPSQSGTRLPYDRFCGNGFVTTTSSGSPYTLYVTTSAVSTTTSTNVDVDNRGFYLNYRLLPC